MLSTYPRHCLTRGGPPKASGDGSRNPWLPELRGWRRPRAGCVQGRSGARRTRGALSLPKTPLLGFGLPPPKAAPPRLPMAGSLRAGRGGDGGAGQGPCRAEPGCAGCAAEGSGRSSPSAGLRSPRAGRGAGMSPPACTARGARHGPARHGTARGTAERSSAAPRPPGTAAVSRVGLGAPVATPEAEGGSLLFLSSAGLLLRSFAVRCATQPSSPDVRSFVLFAASSQPGMRSDSIGTHAACTVLQPQGCTQGLVTFLRTLGEMNSSPWGKKTGEGSPTEPVRWFWKYRGSFSAHL